MTWQDYWLVHATIIDLGMKSFYFKVKYHLFYNILCFNLHLYYFALLIFVKLNEMIKKLEISLFVILFLTCCEKDFVSHQITKGETFTAPSENFTMCDDFDTFDPTYFGIIFPQSGNWKVFTNSTYVTLNNGPARFTSTTQFSFKSDTVYSFSFSPNSIYQGRYCIEFKKIN